MAEYNPILSAPQGANKKPKRVGRGSSLLLIFQMQQSYVKNAVLQKLVIKLTATRKFVYAVNVEMFCNGKLRTSA